MDKSEITSEEWQHCLKVLNLLKADPLLLPDDQGEEMKTLITKIYKQARKNNRKNNSERLLAEDQKAVQETSIILQAREKKLDDTIENEPTAKETDLNKSKTCYSCRTSYQKLHFFYHRLCPSCASLNYDKRFERTDLTGRVAIVTGGRVKVGYATALKMLRDGAKTIVTTRFPYNALLSFQKEADYHDWKENLIVYGLDLRYFDQIDKFIQFVHDSFKHLDILINNAAQTIKYPEEYYRPLLAVEQGAIASGVMAKNLIASTSLTPEASKTNTHQELLKDIPLNRFNQPIDNRKKNSWVSVLDEINTEELVEVNLINNIAPFILNSQLKALLNQSPFDERFIINVTSSEGQFSYPNKKVHHPHTNMTKAALNMMTRTSAEDYANDKIYMSSVDVGWVSTGVPEEKRKRLFDQGDVPPLDPVDSAARIYHPIISTLIGHPIHGKLIKDYVESDW